MLQSTAPESGLTRAEHVTAIVNALNDFNLSPYQVAWHYLQAAFAANERNVLGTARSLGVHRRTLQRALKKNQPTRVQP